MLTGEFDMLGGQYVKRTYGTIGDLNEWQSTTSNLILVGSSVKKILKLV